MTKLYYVHRKNYKDMSPEIKSLEVIAETEYHWTYKGASGPYACAKKDSHFTSTPEEAMERFIAEKEEALQLARQHAEEIISMLMYLNENKDKLINQANDQ